MSEVAKLPTSVPPLILAFFFTSPVSLYLNIQCIRAYFKYEVLRKAPSDILTTLAVIYGFRDIIFIIISIFTLFFTDESESFNQFACNLTSYLTYINLYLVYTYSSALNIFLGLTSQSSALYTEESTRAYHFLANGFAFIFFLLCIFSGTQYQSPTSICILSLGPADGIVPSIFVATLFFFSYRLYLLRKKTQTSTFAAKNKSFMDTFSIYVYLSYAYTLERMIRYFVDNNETSYGSFYDVPVFEQILYYLEYIIASLLTFTIFVIRYYDESTRKKLRSLIGLEKTDSPQLVGRKMSDGGPVRRKKSEKFSLEGESYSAEVTFSLNMRKTFLVSIMSGIHIVLENAQEVIENLTREELEKIPINLNRTEDYSIAEEDITADIPIVSEACKKLGVELTKSRVSFQNFYMQLRQIINGYQSIDKMRASFDMKENLELLEQGFEDADHMLSWITHDSRFRIQIIDVTFCKFLVQFWRDLYSYQRKKETCIVQSIIGVGHYSIIGSQAEAFFLITKNKFIQHDASHIEESFCIKPSDFSHFGEKKRFLELKKFLKESSHVKPDRMDAFEDIVFLQEKSILFSIVVNVVKISPEKRVELNESTNYIEIYFQNFQKLNSDVEVLKYTKHINTIFDTIYNKSKF